MWERTLQAAELPEMVLLLLSKDEDDQLKSTARFREWLARKTNPPIDAVVESGIVRRFVELLKKSKCLALRMDAAWVLTNIAYGTSEQTKTVIDAGAVPVFVKLLDCQFSNIQEQALWALSNIAGDCPEFRDVVLAHGIMEPLLRILSDSQHIIKNAMWALRNLCRGYLTPSDFAKVSSSLPVLFKLLFHEDYAVLTDSCWAIAYLIDDGIDINIQVVIDAGVCKRLVELLMHRSRAVHSAALRAVGNIVVGNDVQTQEILNLSVITSLLRMLNTNNSSVRVLKECCWIISNITAGSQSQIQEVIDANVIPVLINILNTVTNYQTRKEIAWAIKNISSGGSADQIRFLVSSGCIPIFCDLLASVDYGIIQVALETLKNILFSGNMNAKNNGDVNVYAALVKECSGYEHILALKHPEYLSAIARYILETYFENKRDTM